MRNLAQSLEGFEDRRVTVLGDAILDGYLEGYAERVCREAPVPVVRLDGEHFACGGAANMAANLAAMGAKVRFVTVVGDDTDGCKLRDMLGEAGVDCDFIVTDSGRETIAKRRLVADGQLLVRFDTGSMGPVSSDSAKEVFRQLCSAMEKSDALIVSDYHCGLLADEVISGLSSWRSGYPHTFLVIDSTRLARYRALEPDLVKPSLSEALSQLALTPAPPDSRGDLAEALGDALLDVSGARLVALTLDEDGAIVFSRADPPVRTPATFHGTAHPAGAGDTYLAAFTLSSTSGASVAAAADLASVAAGIVVAEQGTSLCQLQRLHEALDPSRRDKVCLPDQLATVARRLHADKAKVVFTNGCFDLLHPGHVALLQRARQLGDVLVVGVNSDESVAGCKGPGRPVNSLEDRLRVLSALSCIDLLVPFDDDTADSLLAALRPQVYVKGGDYSAEDIPEAERARAVGARVEILPFFGSDSTTRIIDRIRATTVETAS